jgi:hypothetical protein
LVKPELQRYADQAQILATTTLAPMLRLCNPAGSKSFTFQDEI